MLRLLGANCIAKDPPLYPVLLYVNYQQLFIVFIKLDLIQLYTVHV